MARPKQRRIPIVERVVGLVSLAIVLGTVGYLLFEAVQDGPDVPLLSLTVAAVRESGGSFIVDVSIHNSSRRAAAEVHLAGVARSADGRDMRSEVRVDYVPGLSTRSASLVFDADPGRADVRIMGYVVP